MNNPSWLSELTFTDRGLIPVIAQDANSHRILMFAWMNEEALIESVETGRAVYWSRSRQKLWRKGEESGHQQWISEIRLDCDGDVVTLIVEQVGNIACHTGRESCFFRVLKNGEWHVTDSVIKSPEEIYKK
ncbi:MAG: phosphoribosyl-AMP cyclohydrolase [Pseudomonadales bacterium]|nr:phosphoribosyl-AMP cyclohydrolase [Pseudomonadales bacterium]